MKKTLLALVLLLCLALTACGGQGEKFPLTLGYEGLEDSVKNNTAVAVIRYDPDPRDLTVTDSYGRDEDAVLIFPQFVGSIVELYFIRAEGSNDFSLYDKPQRSITVKEDTVIRLNVDDLGPNRMWYLKVSTPDGESFGTPIPYPCETNKSLVYVGKSWNGKDCLPKNWGETVEELEPTLKPVIYLYPEEETRVEVSLDYCGELTCTYPKYKHGWTVTAQPDGTLTDESGKEYNYLYWEGVGYDNFDFSEGFCVAGEDTAAFLENALEALGLTRREANEFIVFWLPMMEENPYNIIAFQTETYEEAAKLHISPKPDSLIRIFMAWYGSQEAVNLPEQQLITPDREGFTVVEWGGTGIK